MVKVKSTQKPHVMMPKARHRLIAVGFCFALATTAFLSSSQTSERSASYAAVAHLLERDVFDQLQPVHQNMLVSLASRSPTNPSSVALCFTEPLRWEAMDAFNQAITGGNGATKFQLTGRWTNTITNGTGLQQGDPTTITYSFVPDGTSILSGVGEPVGNSNLFAVFDALFGSTQAWQDKYHQMFAVWSASTGITYVHEPNDDGKTMFPVGGFTGAIGVRGDIRIGGKSIDGQSGPNILAFNMFPNNGDMVMDTDNTTFFGDPSASFRRLRNVIAHEAGHGMGLFHVCPLFTVAGTIPKLMEPIATASFEGPQHDDILAANRHYGDPFENNDSTGTATDLGILNDGTITVRTPSIDDNGDADFYQFTVTSPKELSTVLRPVGFTYLQGPQTANCDTGTSFNSLAVKNLALEVRDTDGVTVLASADLNPAGQNETLNNVVLSSGPGTYFLRIASGSVDNAQLYEVDLTIAPTTLITDCNNNGIADSQDIAAGTSLDNNGNGIPDECEIFGDTDGDGDVDGIDFTIFASCFNQAGNPPRTLGCDPPHGTNLDFDGDGDIDGIDFTQFAACFNRAGNPPRCGI